MCVYIYIMKKTNNNNHDDNTNKNYIYIHIYNLRLLFNYVFQSIEISRVSPGRSGLSPSRCQEASCVKARTNWMMGNPDSPESLVKTMGCFSHGEFTPWWFTMVISGESILPSPTGWNKLLASPGHRAGFSCHEFLIRGSNAVSQWNPNINWWGGIDIKNHQNRGSRRAKEEVYWSSSVKK